MGTSSWRDADAIAVEDAMQVSAVGVRGLAPSRVRKALFEHCGRIKGGK
jgi:hypothetical protein